MKSSAKKQTASLPIQSGGFKNSRKRKLKLAPCDSTCSSGSRNFFIGHTLNYAPPTLAYTPLVLHYSFDVHFGLSPAQRTPESLSGASGGDASMADARSTM